MDCGNSKSLFIILNELFTLDTLFNELFDEYSKLFPIKVTIFVIFVWLEEPLKKLFSSE